MTRLSKLIRSESLLRDERGLSTVEYVILACLIAVVAFGAWRKFGGTVKTKTEAGTIVIDSLPESSEGGGDMG